MNHKKFTQIFASILIGCALCMSGCASMTPMPSEAATPEPPKSVVETFYKWYLDYEGNPLVDRAYRTSSDLTPNFIQEVDEIIASFDKGAYDPFLCAQDIPAHIQIGEAEQSDEEATVIVQEIWNPETDYESVHEVEVTLHLVEEIWKIDGITCSAPEIPESTPEQVATAFYEWYLSYIDRSSGEMRNPLVDGAYRANPYLSDRLIQEVDALMASSDKKGGFDPFLCAQDIPERFKVEASKISGETAQVTLNTYYTGNPDAYTLKVTLTNNDGVWKIDQIVPDESATSEPETKPEIMEEAPAGASSSEAGVLFKNDTYGFQLTFPQDWTYEESPAVQEGFTVPESMQALKSVLFFAPQGWQGVAPPLSVDITEGTEAAFQKLYVPAEITEPLTINDQKVIKTIEDLSSVQIIHYTFQNPHNETIRIVFTDALSGFPKRLEGHEAVAAQLEQIIESFTFTK